MNERPATDMATNAATLMPMMTIVARRPGGAEVAEADRAGLLRSLMGAVRAVEPDRCLGHAAGTDRTTATLARHARPTIVVAVAGRDRCRGGHGSDATERSIPDAAAPGRRSATGEVGSSRAVLEERGHPDPGIVGGEHLDEEVLLEAQAGGERASRPSSMARLARAWAARGPRAYVAASSRARSRVAPEATTSSTRPMARASSARTWRPESTRSLARAGPTRRARRWVPPPPGMMPRRISGWPSLAVSDTSRKSQASASSQPPPRAGPAMAAIVTLGMAATADSASRNRARRSPGPARDRRTRRCRPRRRRSDRCR